ncbi:PQQ-binding-like beta-propeller repeat protein [Actinomadura sp. WMMB 499]|uniref:outer membrane protein assembly factor BamB family protein n=1 Tax=Actinomadura sp. WMMB 499 TaxID=1219491 RepID=UPI001246F50A|nr:PQQ-binding-like beta-propeller repeat protein [Actinomadura sp. WMMB 499]QFG22755.1 PQQ-binding-like beta-propeller repeat protein [Actinomadura sp. WMMB 499]
MAVAPLEVDDPRRIGRYRIVGRLGRGGMGRVYLGLSPGGRAVAVKVVRDELAEDPGFRRRFVREVDAARRVTGFFTAAVVDADPDGEPPWLATAYVPGMSLEAAVAAHGAWPEHSVRALGAALAEALESVHGAGVVHRDLKPSNVLLAPDGPRLIDFGISLAAEGTQLTETGVLIGTPGYIAPERLVRDETTPAGDVFALGAVLAYAATGAGPFGGGAAHALHYRVVHEEPDLGGVPSGLRDIVARCLAKDPGARPAVSDLVAELGGDGAGMGDGGLPARVATEIARVRAAPILAPAETEPTAVDTARPGGRSRGLPRGRVLAGAAVAAALALVAATGALLAVRSSGDGRDDAAGPPEWKERWTFPLDGDLRPAGYTERTVYLSSEAGDLYALDADSGEERWRKRYPGKYPELLDGTDEIAYYADGRYTYALDAQTGEQLWKYEDHGINGEHMTFGGTTYKTFFTWLIALDPRTGDEIWRESTEGAKWDRLTTAAGVLYLSDGADAVHAVDAENGRGLWRYDAGNEIGTAPVFANGTVYFGTKDGTLHAVDADSGREDWRHGFDGAAWNPIIADGAGLPAVSGEAVYYENDGYVVALDTGTGRPLWTHEPGLDEEIMLLAVRDGQVLYRDGPEDQDRDETVYALDARTGERLWDDVLGENTDIVGDTLYFVDDGGTLRAVSATGRA